MTHRLHSYNPRTREHFTGSVVFPKWLAEQKAAALNEMPAMVKDGIVWSAEPVKAQPVKRPSYREFLRGER